MNLLQRLFKGPMKGVLTDILTDAKYMQMVSEALAPVIRNTVLRVIEDEQVLTAISTQIGDGITGRMGGIASGISRQMKGLERDLLAEGIAQGGVPPMAAEYVAKYIQKYPFLQMFLPAVLGQIKQTPTESKGDDRLRLPTV